MNRERANRLYLFIIVFVAITIGFIVGYLVGSRQSKESFGHIPSKSGKEVVLEGLSQADLPLQERNTGPQKINRDNGEGAENLIKSQSEGISAGNEDSASKGMDTETRKVIYTVQVGAFKSEREAQTLETRLRKKGYNNIYIVNDSNAGGGFFKVKIGDFEKKKEAEIFAIKLRKTEGLKAFVTKK